MFGNGSYSFNIPCGCQQRKEIMGAGDWGADLLILFTGAFIVAIVFMLNKKGVL